VTNILTEITAFLPRHRFYFRPHYRNVYGLATFIHENVVVKEEGELFVFKEQGFENPQALGITPGIFLLGGHLGGAHTLFEMRRMYRRR
jgi:hypothetical protein